MHVNTDLELLIPFTSLRECYTQNILMVRCYDLIVLLENLETLIV